MKKILTSQVKMWHLIVLAIVVTFLTSATIVAAEPLAGGFWGAGTIMIAAASGTDSSQVTVPKGYADTVVLQKAITIPPGKSADLAVIGSADIEGGASTGYQYCFGQYRLDAIGGSQFKPGNYILEGFNPPPNNLTVPINGFITKVPSGQHTVYMVMEAGYADCYILNRSMIIIANIH